MFDDIPISEICPISCGVDCPVYGCLDETACNYNSDANIDDGSCEFSESGFDCEGNCFLGLGTGTVVTLTLTDDYGDGWFSDDYLVIGETYFTMGGGSSESFTLCLDLSTCVNIYFGPPSSNYSGEMGYSIVDASGELIAEHVGSCLLYTSPSPRD